MAIAGWWDCWFLSYRDECEILIQCQSTEMCSLWNGKEAGRWETVFPTTPCQACRMWNVAFVLGLHSFLRLSGPLPDPMHFPLWVLVSPLSTSCSTGLTTGLKRGLGSGPCSGSQHQLCLPGEVSLTNREYSWSNLPTKNILILGSHLWRETLYSRIHEDSWLWCLGSGTNPVWPVKTDWALCI